MLLTVPGATVFGCGHVCALFVGKSTTAAASQVKPAGTATDVYINTRLLSQVTQATLLHEALHNLTGLHDFLGGRQRLGLAAPVDLKTFVGIEPVPNVDPNPGRSTDINDQLRAKSCVAN
jgi:hypothetical protein